MKNTGPIVWPASTGLIQTGGGPVNRLHRKRQREKGRRISEGGRIPPLLAKRRAPRTRRIINYSAVVLGTTVVEPVAAVLPLAGLSLEARAGPDFT